MFDKSGTLVNSFDGSRTLISGTAIKWHNRTQEWNMGNVEG